MRPKTLGKALLSAVIGTAILLVCLAAPLIGAIVPSDASYRTWDVTAEVTEDGGIATTQVLDAQLRSREDNNDDPLPWRQAYTEYTLQSWQVTGLSNISVKNLTTGEEYTQIDPVCSTPSSFTEYEWNSQCAGHWYIADVTHSSSHPQLYTPLDVTDRQYDGETKKVELGWNFPSIDHTNSLKFQLEVTFDNAVTAYSDVDEFQWSVRDDSDEIPVGELNVTLTLPDGVTSDNSWAWLHTEAQSENSRSDNGRVLHFSATNLKAEQYVDVVVMYDPPASARVSRTIDDDIQQSLYDSEEAKQAAWKEKQHDVAVRKVITWIVTAIIGFGLSITALVIALRKRKQATYNGPIEYWREPPEMSPAAAAKLCSELAPERGTMWQTNAMTATVMSLMDKGAIGIYPGHASRYAGIDMSRPNVVSLAQMIDLQEPDTSTSTIVLNPVIFSDARAQLNLSKSENAALDLLIRASKRIGSPVFDLKQMNKCFKKDRDAYKFRDVFTSAAVNEYNALHVTKRVSSGVIVGTFACVASIMFGILYAAAYGEIALVFCISLPTMFIGALAMGLMPGVVLTPTDNKYAGEVLGLKKYLEDYSDFSDRGVLDMVLWGRYMVYAAAFGISDKALAQLIRAYPQVADPRWLDNNAVGFGLMYWSMRPAGPPMGGPGGPGGMFGGHAGSLGSQLNSSFKSISSTIAAAAPSSSGGSGGSFSGGGFGGGGGGGGGGSHGFR